MTPTTGNWELDATNVASGSVDGDSVTISTLTGAGGDVLATREFLADEIVENANCVSVTVTSDKEITFGIVDDTNSVVAYYLVFADSTVDLYFNIGSPIAGYKLVVLNNYIQSGTSVELPVTVSVSNVIEQYIKPVVPTEDFWTVYSTNVASSSQGSYAGYLEISELTTAGTQTGANLATHTVDITEGAGQLLISYIGNGIANDAVSFIICDATTSREYGSFTPDGVALTSSYTLTWSDYDVVPTTVVIVCITNANTVANLPVGFHLSYTQE